MKSRKLQFEGAFGDTLSARLDQPENTDPEAIVLFAHCFTCSKNLKAVVNISRALTDQSFGVFRFDFTGLGESEGDFADTNFSSNIDDLIKAAEYLQAEFRGPEILLGHSLGGAAVLQAADRISQCKAVATIAAPSKPDHVIQNFAAKLEKIEEQGQAQVTLAGRSFTIKKQFLDDLEQRSMNQKIKNLGRGLLIFHSPIDSTVGIQNAAQIFKLAKHPKSFISLDKANHLLSNPDDSEYTGHMLATWASNLI